MIKEVYKNIYQATFPLTGNPLKSINIFVIKTKDYNLIIDTGFNNEEGSQILEDKANEILNNLDRIESFSEVKIGDFEKLISDGKIEYFGENLDKDYFDDVLSLTINDDNIDKNVKIVYTPLNGTGNRFVRHILDVRGFKNVYVVK